MQKFIAAFDGLDFSQSTLEYAIEISRKNNAHLVGVFLEDFTLHSYSAADITRYEGASFDKHLEELNAKDEKERKGSIERFEEACQKAGINHSIHRDKNIALQDLLHESVYTDLLIVGAAETLTRYEEPLPTRFIRDLLGDVLCPVMLVPEKYKPFSSVCFLYDGDPSSVYAVRMFSYIFSSDPFPDKEVLTVKGAKQSLHLPDNRLMKEFMKRHYPDAQYTLLKGDPEEEITAYLKKQKKNMLVVLGAYRRGRLFRTFRPSMADWLMHHLALPLFVAHNRS